MNRIIVVIALGLVACGDQSNQERVALVEQDSPVLEIVDTPQDQPNEGFNEEAIASLAAVSTGNEIWTPIEEPVELDGETQAQPLLQFAEYELRRGESLAHFARWSGLTVETIADSSSLSLNGTYPVGTKITVPLTVEEQGSLDTFRDEHHIKRVEGYLASRGGSNGSEFYKVQTGDSAWIIARSRLGIPVWMLESYNPSVNLDNLQPGQELMVPIIDDVVVSADE